MEDRVAPPQDERRECVRINDVIGLEARPVSTENRESLRARELVAPPPKGLPELLEGYETEESMTLRYLEAINAKLDLLIKHLVADQSGLGDLKTQSVSLSATGITFRSPTLPREGEAMEVRLVLPGPPPIWLCVYVDVLRAEGPDPEGQYTISGRFIDLPEDIQEHLMKHIFDRQREEIRRRRQDRYV